jgi:hypothetical protein
MSDFPRPQLTPQQRAARTHRALCFDFSAVSSADAAHLAQAMADALDAATATGAAALPPRLKLIEQVVAGTRANALCTNLQLHHLHLCTASSPHPAVLRNCIRLARPTPPVASQSRSRVATGHQQLLAVIVVRLPLAVLRACAEHMVASSRTAMHHAEADGDADASASPVPPRVVALLGPLIGDLRGACALCLQRPYFLGIRP